MFDPHLYHNQTGVKIYFQKRYKCRVVSAVQIIKYWLGWPNCWNSLNNCVIVLSLYGLVVRFNFVYFQSHTFSGTRHKFLHRIHFDLWSVVFKDMEGVQNIHQENPTNGRYFVKTKYTIRVSLWFHRAIFSRITSLSSLYTCGPTFYQFICVSLNNNKKKSAWLSIYTWTYYNLWQNSSISIGLYSAVQMLFAIIYE